MADAVVVKEKEAYGSIGIHVEQKGPMVKSDSALHERDSAGRRHTDVVDAHLEPEAKILESLMLTSRLVNGSHMNSSTAKLRGQELLYAKAREAPRHRAGDEEVLSKRLNLKANAHQPRTLIRAENGSSRAEGTWPLHFQRAGEANAQSCQAAVTADVGPPTVAFCIAGMARTFATPLVLASLRWNLVEALAGPFALAQPSTTARHQGAALQSRLFLLLKVGVSLKLNQKTSEAKYFASARKGNLGEDIDALHAALHTPWVRSMIGEVALLNGSGAHSGAHSRAHSQDASPGGEGAAARDGNGSQPASQPPSARAVGSDTSAAGKQHTASKAGLRPGMLNVQQSDSRRWLSHRHPGCVRQARGDENGEERAIHALLCMRWCGEAIVRHEAVHRGGQFDVVAFVRPDYFFDVPMLPWCQWLARPTKALACFSGGPKDQHGDAFWVTPRHHLAAFTHAPLEMHANCSLLKRSHTSHMMKDHSGDCCGAAEAILLFALTRQHVPRLDCARPDLPYGWIFRNVKSVPSLGSGERCRATCHKASYHACDIALNDVYGRDANYRFQQFGYLELRPQAGLALRKLFGSNRSQCHEATRPLHSMSASL